MVRPIRGCGLYAGAAYTRVNTVVLKLFVSKRNLKHNDEFKILQFKLFVATDRVCCLNGR